MIRVSRQSLRTISSIEKEEQFRPASISHYREAFTLSIDENELRKIVYEQLERMVKESGLCILGYKQIDDSMAEKEISGFISTQKSINVDRISVLEVVSSLMLCPEQVERIFRKFEQAGRISEIDE